MKRKQKVDLTVAIFLILMGASLLVFPVLNIYNVKCVVISVFIIYAIANLIQFLLTYKEKDYESLLSVIAAIVPLLMMIKIDITVKPWNLAIVLFVWVILMSLIKLKKSDYYNDRHSKMWIFRMISLGIFAITGILSAINLYYTADIQILVLGFFFLIHGILELVDPVINYLIGEKK